MGESLTTSIQEQIDFFFTPPFPTQSGSLISTLRLVRQEAQVCLIGDVIPEDHVISDPRKRQRLFATTMVIMAGVDLLAKFYAGADDNRGSGERIQRFLTTFMFNDERAAKEEYAQVLYYGCRNPLSQSFTLHQTKFSVFLSDKPPTGVVFPLALALGGYQISVEGLYHAFLNTLKTYETELRAASLLQSNFTLMFPSYGSVGIRPRLAR